MVKSPLITILIASYNRLKLLKECIASVLDQQSDEYEVLIIDDGSDTPTKNWLASIKSSLIRVIYQSNKGVASARQVGLEKALGSYVCILDSDDLLLPHAILEICDNIQKNQDIDLFYCNNVEVHPSGKKRKSKYKRFDDSEHFIKGLFTYPRVPFKHSGTTFKTSLAMEVGGYDTNLDSKIDIDFLIKFLKHSNKFSLIEEPLVTFYFHGNSISRKKRISGIKRWWLIIDRYSSDSKLVKFNYKVLRTLIEVSKFCLPMPLIDYPIRFCNS